MDRFERIMMAFIAILVFCAVVFTAAAVYVMVRSVG